MKMLDLSPILFLNVKTNGPVQVKQTKGDHAPSMYNQFAKQETVAGADNTE
jgi:hypothetical protein